MKTFILYLILNGGGMLTGEEQYTESECKAKGRAMVASQPTVKYYKCINMGAEVTDPKQDNS